MDFFLFSTPLGQMGLAADGELGAITRLYLPNDPTPRLMPRATALLERGREQLLDYLAGLRREFDLPLAPEGPPFQQRVWNVIREIPYGTTLTYSIVARLAGSSASCRAVGSACNRNPLLLAVPCHRVVGASGKLVGFACGLEVKDYLLRHEAGFL